MDFTCRELVELVSDFLEGAIQPGERARFELHLAGCEGCSAYLEQMRTTVALGGRLREASLDPAVRDLLLTAFRDWNRPTPPPATA